jgi:hypothetical protein
MCLETRADQSALRRSVGVVQTPIENAKILVDGETAQKSSLDRPALICVEHAAKQEMLR